MATAASMLPHRLGSLSAFTLERVLNDGGEGGSVNVLGKVGGVSVLVKIVRQPLPTDADALLPFLQSLQLAPRMPYSGAEYGYYASEGVSVDVVSPHAPSLAADAVQAQMLLSRLVERSTAQPAVLVRETPALSTSAHAPVSAALPPAGLDWLRKILAKEKEVERVLLDVPEFLLNSAYWYVWGISSLR